jgi:hypothetical protein
MFHDDGTACLSSATNSKAGRASQFRHHPGIILQDCNVPVKGPQATTNFALDNFLGRSLSTQRNARVDGAESLHRVDAARLAGSTVLVQARSRWLDDLGQPRLIAGKRHVVLVATNDDHGGKEVLNRFGRT